jgi:hypothetical protein
MGHSLAIKRRVPDMYLSLDKSQNKRSPVKQDQKGCQGV